VSDEGLHERRLRCLADGRVGDHLVSEHCAGGVMSKEAGVVALAAMALYLAIVGLIAGVLTWFGAL
jgi:hypothetical protein